MRDIREILPLFPHRYREMLSDAGKSNLRECREWLKELRDNLILVPEFRTFNSYVSYIHSRGGGGCYRNGLWIGMADKRFGNPRNGIQFQFGVSGDRIWADGIWIEGKGNARHAKEIAYKSLVKAPKLFIKKMNQLGNDFSVRIWDVEEKEDRIKKKCGAINHNDFQRLIEGIEDRDCHVHIGQCPDVRGLGKHISKKVIQGFENLVPLYAFLKGDSSLSSVQNSDAAYERHEIRTVSSRKNYQLDYKVRKKEQVIRAQKNEARLLKNYEDWLKRQARKLEVAKYGRLECDGFEPNHQNLIEAKSSSSREHVRMAVGQLLDYAFQGRRKYPHPKMAILLPNKPALDVEKWLKSLRISVVWYDDGIFRDNAGGRFA